jgi:hypothetical protein
MAKKKEKIFKYIMTNDEWNEGSILIKNIMDTNDDEVLAVLLKELIEGKHNTQCTKQDNA